MGMDQAELDAVIFQQDLALHGRQFQQAYNKHAHDKSFRNRLGILSFLQRVAKGCVQNGIRAGSFNCLIHQRVFLIMCIITVDIY